MIEIVAAREDWPDEFARLKPILRRACPQLLAIHHIGSTAVPNLAAKDVIDIQVTVDDLASVDIEAFEREGFAARPGLVDHCPPGLDLPPQELTKHFFKRTVRPANVHVREQGRFNQRYALLFRDYLRAHPGAASAYGLIKQRLVAFFPDNADAYYDIKDPVCDLIMATANEWALYVDWSEPTSD